LSVFVSAHDDASGSMVAAPPEITAILIKERLSFFILSTSFGNYPDIFKSSDFLFLIRKVFKEWIFKAMSDFIIDRCINDY